MTQDEPVDGSWRYESLRQRAKQAVARRDAEEIPFLLRGLEIQDRDAGPAVALVCARALGHLGLDLTGTHLRRLARSEDPRERALAAAGLGVSRDARALPVIVGLLADTVDEVVLAAALAGSRLGDQAVPTLAQELEKSAGRLPRAGYLVDALHKIGSRESRQRLNAVLATMSIDDRARLLAFVSVEDL
jgi:HEAT repeat protein